MTSNFNVVITNSNFHKEIANFELALQNASFISIDTEFSGVGYNKNLKLNNVQDRYNFVSKLVKSRSLLQLGIAIFTEKHLIQINNNVLSPTPTNELSSISIDTPSDAGNSTILNENKKRLLNDTYSDDHAKQESSSNNEQPHQQPQQHFEYEVRMFTFLCLNQSEFSVFPSSMTFLAQHGFDFNKLFQDGIHLQTKKHSELPPQSKQKRIIELLSRHQLPLVIHNGFYDLLFLFQSFIDDLPEQLNIFIAKLIKVFPKIYDTKFISEYKVTENRSYLQYLFMKYERHNYQRSKANHSYIKADLISGFGQNTQAEPLVNIISSNSKPYDGTKICSDFANHGYCKNGVTCKTSHDINIILDEDEKRKSTINNTPTKINNNNNNNINSPSSKKQKQETVGTIGTTLGAPTLPTSQIQSSNGSSESRPLESETNESNSIPPQPSPSKTPKPNENTLQSNENNINITSSTTTATTETTEITEITEITHKTPTKTSNTNNSEDDNHQVQQQQQNQQQQAHSAGYDSAMTGFIFAYYQKLLPTMNDIDNRIYLTGKNVPLLLKKSNYA